ncbi:hypothetical protein WA026_019880 [Henosepilachna vigintioctopunctata]|uniref:Uncharacterized protein n=1 Tax=Henosepilachna vigintioctopunctata TaxID=420089 RepID=A0AAW1VIN6_9CUCU
MKLDESSTLRRNRTLKGGYFPLSPRQLLAVAETFKTGRFSAPIKLSCFRLFLRQKGRGLCPDVNFRTDVQCEASTKFC